MHQNRIMYCICDVANQRFLVNTVFYGYSTNSVSIYSHRFNNHISEAALDSKKRMIERLQLMKGEDVYTDSISSFEPFCLEVKKVRISYNIEEDKP